MFRRLSFRYKEEEFKIAGIVCMASIVLGVYIIVSLVFAYSETNRVIYGEKLPRKLYFI